MRQREREGIEESESKGSEQLANEFGSEFFN